MIEITAAPIDVAAVLESVASPLTGATVLFLGTTREVTGERRTRWLDYDCYTDMARVKLEQLESEARQRWPIEGCAIVHRIGRVEIGQSSVAVAVSSPHRQDGFEAAKWLIDTLKEVVPIWKQEHWADGSNQWVHPGIAGPEPGARS